MSKETAPTTTETHIGRFSALLSMKNNKNDNRVGGKVLIMKTYLVISSSFGLEKIDRDQTSSIFLFRISVPNIEETKESYQIL